MLNKQMWRFGAILAAASMALSLAACASGGTGAPTDAHATTGDAPIEVISWKHGIVHQGTEAGFLLMAQKLGLFEKYGVDVEYVEFSSAQQTFPALVAGQIDSLEGSPGGIFPVVQQGQDIRIVGATMPGLAWAIYARKGINDLKDLEGKSMAISVSRALPDQAARAMLTEAGVDPESLTYVNAGGNPDRYKAVVAGTVDAASGPADYAPRAKADGLNVVAFSADIIPDFPRYMVMASGKALDERPEGMVRFLAAMSEGIQYALDHPDEAAALTAASLDVDVTDESVTYMTDYIIDNNLLAPTLEAPVNKLDFLQQVMLSSGELTEKIDTSTLVDDSFQKKALALVKEMAKG